MNKITEDSIIQAFHYAFPDIIEEDGETYNKMFDAFREGISWTQDMVIAMFLGKPIIDMITSRNDDK